jgi:Fe-S oxidoreductase
MNPGKIVDPYLADENLRWGPDYRPWEPETHFQFPHDAGRFALATERCVGIGKCRADHGGTMCPSYRVLREEKHVTRGRAHLLNEMLRGDPLVRRWDSPEVFDSLDYCLSCKGCKGDCPVNVDVATYKAEFLSHHYEGRLRPPHAYALGMAHAWIRAAAVAPNVANLILRESSATRLGKRLVGITSARPTPRIAEQTFRRWFVRRGGARAVGERVILWPDTFNNNLHPHVAQAAVRVLENAGFRVEIPRLDVCCGRPLYDYGFLGLAKRTLVRDLRILRDAITEGVPVVGLEPSCVSVFRDELPNLLHRNEDAHRLAGQTFTLAEFLRDRADSVDLPRWSGRVLLHGHCHQKAILDFKSEADIIRRMGADLVVPDSGCCGLAGSFGFEAEKYDVSMQIGEHEIFGPIRQEPDSTAIVTDGFSCREQVRHGTGRRALHFAELLERAVRA